MKKYSFTGETRTLFCGTTVHRIIAERDFGNVKKGDVGGWIPEDFNLSHKDNSWIGEGSIICGGVKLGKNTVVGDYTRIYRGVTLGDNAVVGSWTKIHEGVTLGDNIIVGDYTVVGDNTEKVGG